MSPHVELKEVFAGMSRKQIEAICDRAGVDIQTVNVWINKRKSARIDLFQAVLNAAGYRLVRVPIESADK